MKEPNTDVENNGEKTGGQPVKKKAGKKKKSLFERLGFRIVRLRDEIEEEPESAAQEAAEGEEAAPESEKKAAPAEKKAAPAEKKAKPKKEKAKPKKKPKKAKPKPKPKAKKPAKKKKAAAEDGKKKKPILLIVIIAAVVVAGGVIAAIFLLGGSKDPAALLEKAQGYVQEEDWGKAQEIFWQLIGSEEEIPADILTESYLGSADVYLVEEKADMAIVTLEQGLERTGDRRIADKLEELSPSDPDQPRDASRPDTNQPVVWKDPALEKMVRMALGKTETQDIMTDDLKDITKLKILGDTHATVNLALEAYNTVDYYMIEDVRYTERGGIASLDDLVHFKSLTSLVIGYNQISDISAIASLTSLETLGLYCNEISDISALSGLTGLRFVYLYNNSVSDLSALSGLAQLREVWMQKNALTDLSPLAGLTDLRQLFVSDNNISDVSPVSKIPTLAFLYADNNNISDLSSLSDMESLTDVSFVGNPVTDLSPVSHVGNVNRAYAAVPSAT